MNFNVKKGLNVSKKSWWDQNPCLITEWSTHRFISLRLLRCTPCAGLSTSPCSPLVSRPCSFYLIREGDARPPEAAPLRPVRRTSRPLIWPNPARSKAAYEARSGLHRAHFPPAGLMHALGKHSAPCHSLTLWTRRYSLRPSLPLRAREAIWWMPATRSTHRPRRLPICPGVLFSGASPLALVLCLSTNHSHTPLRQQIAAALPPFRHLRAGCLPRKMRWRRTTCTTGIEIQLTSLII